MKWLGGITDSMDMNLSKFQEIVKDNGSLACCRPWGLQKVRRDSTTEQEQVLIIFIMLQIISLAFVYLITDCKFLLFDHLLPHTKILQYY